MKGLYKGKYLIGYYDKDDFPIFIASTLSEFNDFYKKHKRSKGGINTAAQAIIRRDSNHSDGEKIILIEADTITHDCFENEDKEFIKFIEETRKKTIHEMAKELDVSPITFYYKKRGIRHDNRSRL